jgi:putative oxidoreductase
MDVVLVLGRVLLVALPIFSGLTVHQSREGVEAAKASGSPAPELLVPLSGAGLAAGGAMVALGLWADAGALILIATLLPITYYMHAFWKFEGMDRIMQQTNFFKNFAMIGGLVIVFWAYNQGQDLPASLTDALFGRI